MKEGQKERENKIERKWNKEKMGKTDTWKIE
jgi:hypothetical protein